MLLHPTTIDTSMMTFDKVNRTLATEDSMLPRPSQAYDDACDLGYTVVSQHTDERIVFVETDIVRRDGDILYWVYRPAREDLTARRTNALDLTLVIFND